MRLRRLLGVKRPRVKRDFCPEAIDVTWCGDISYINTFPVVWGISATITRFEDAMKGVTDRSPPERVEVDIDKVRASGLVKDEIGLDEPDEAGTFSTTLLREAVKATLDYERRWAAYSADQDEPEVMPVLVVQGPDKASVAKLSELIDVIESEWPGLGPNAIAHVFGEHERRYVGGRAVDRVRPVSIQNDTDVRVVLVKQAISTGWDCPRAEVLYSERPARDVMYIAQIIGRMVRSPLTHRVTTDDALNSVACFLLLFDRSALEDIKAELEGRGTTQGELRVGAAMVRAPKVFEHNPTIDPAAFDIIRELPALPAPDALADPIRRAKQLAHLLTDTPRGDALMPDAGARLTKSLMAKLDGLATQWQRFGEAPSRADRGRVGEMLALVTDVARERNANPGSVLLECLPGPFSHRLSEAIEVSLTSSWGVIGVRKCACGQPLTVHPRHRIKVRAR